MTRVRRLQSDDVAVVAVTSSMMSAVEYDGVTQRLRIFFVDGGWYTYLNVPQSIYEALLAAPSRGRFFHVRINNRFRFIRR